MLQNKIYYNFITEIFKIFFLILFTLSMIALTVRSVSFLDLIVENGYPVAVYFKYSLLNIFGILPKFIPLSFFLAMVIFIVKHLQDSEFIILWTSGVKKNRIVNLFLIISFMTFIIYFLIANFITPYALNKSRQLLSNDNFGSILPTVKPQQFSDTFSGFTLFVEKKLNNELQNIFLHDSSGSLNNLSSNISDTNETTIIAENGIVDKNNMLLFNGQIISNKNNSKNEIIKFEKLNISLANLNTTTIKKPKIQETMSLELLSCYLKIIDDLRYCNENFKKEILPTLTRRMVMPFYIPVITLICSLLLIKTNKKIFSKKSIFFYCFVLLVMTEIFVRYTGLNKLILFTFIAGPIVLMLSIYTFLNLKFLNEAKIK